MYDIMKERADSREDNDKKGIVLIRMIGGRLKILSFSTSVHSRGYNKR